MAVGQGIAIAWWRRAMHGGSVKDLHYSWSFSTSLSSILKKYKYLNIIAVTMLMTKVAIIDGIFYQKGTYTYIDIIRAPNYTNHYEPVNLFAAKVFPITAKMGLSQNDSGLMTYEYEVQTYNWYQVGDDRDQMSVVYDCNGANCHFGVAGAGFMVNCSTKDIAVDYGLTAPTAFSRNADNITGFTNLPLFSVNFTQTWPTAVKNYSAIILDMLYSTPSESEVSGGICPMTLTTMSCELRPAVLSYTVQYTNGTTIPLFEQQHEVKGLELPEKQDQPNLDLYNDRGLQAALNDQPSGIKLDYACNKTNQSEFVEGCKKYNSAWNQAMGVKVLKTVDVVENFEAGADSVLEGLYLAFMTNLASKGMLTYSNATNHSWLVEEDGIISIACRDYDPGVNNCNYSFMDPSQTVLQSINTLTLMTMQRSNLYIDWLGYENNEVEWTDLDYPPLLNGISPEDAHFRNITAIVHYEDIFYGSKPKFLYIALACTIVVILCILPIFYGFWQLGRQVSLNPFEIANAFNSPAFQGVSRRSCR